MKNLKIVFAGTPEFTLPCLEAIQASQHNLLALYTQPDRPSGRGRTIQHSAVKSWGTKHGYSIYQPINFKDPADVELLASLKPDVIVVIAYGLILPTSVLNIPRFGCINVHASLLPRFRGAAPIQYAILSGDEETGVTIMQMDAGMDTGAMLTQASCPILPTDTTTILHDRLSKLAAKPLIQTLDDLAVNKKLSGIPQNNNSATYAPKINKMDARLDWTQSAKVIAQKIRAFQPWPIAYTQMGELLIRIHEASYLTKHTTERPGTILAIDKTGLLVSTGDGVLNIQRIQLPGASIISITDWLNSKKTQLNVSQCFL